MKRPNSIKMNRWWKKQKLVCSYCNKIISRNLPNKHPDKATMEHIVPFSKGGTNDPKNLIPACYQCNSIMNEETQSKLPFIPKYLVKQLIRKDCLQLSTQYLKDWNHVYNFSLKDINKIIHNTTIFAQKENHGQTP